MFSPSYLNRTWSISRRQIGFGWSTRIPPATEILNLNDTCLTAILKLIELQELICLRCICTRWKRIIEKICADTTQLTLSGSTTTAAKGRRRSGSRTELILPKFEPSTLASLLPNLHQLTINFDHKCSTDTLIRFLKLQPRLDSLTLTGHAHLSTKAQLATLLQTINSLCSLTTLNLHLNNLLTESDLTGNLLFILPQLQHLSLSECTFNLYPLLKQLKSIRSLSLMPLPVLMTSDHLKRALTKNKQLQKGLTKVKLTGLKKDSDAVQVIVTKALGLQILDVNEILLTFDLIKCFRKLKHFTTLHLDTIRIDPKLFLYSKLTISYEVTTLRTLTLRNLALTEDLYTELLCRILTTVFPNLEHLVISSFNACILWELEKYRSTFKYLKSWKLIDLGESDDEGEEGSDPDETTESQFLEPLLQYHRISSGNHTVAPDAISFQSLAFAIEKIQEQQHPRASIASEKLENILERQESID